MKIAERITQPTVFLDWSDLAEAVEDYAKKKNPGFNGKIVPEMPEYNMSGLFGQSGYIFRIRSVDK